MDLRMVVIDTETTGLGRSDRIVEIAAITISPQTGEIVDEFETLVNPERDIGPTSIHGITPSMVEAAPTFEEIATALARRLTGAILVGHNLSFDVRMLSQEYGRLKCSFDWGQGRCTLRATKLKLASACARYGVPLSDTHRAYNDALASAMLLKFIGDDASECAAARVNTRGLRHIPRTTRRPEQGGPIRSRISHITDIGNLSFLVDAELVYLDALDHVLDDHFLTEREQGQLAELAGAYGLSYEDRQRLHRQYIELVMKAAHRDGAISTSEHDLLSTLCRSLKIDDLDLPEPIGHSRQTRLPVNAKVCFTGEAIFGGRPLTRPEIEELAVRNGFLPVSSVTRDCQLLVASDPASMSGKARQARRNGIPIMQVDEFISECQVKPYVS